MVVGAGPAGAAAALEARRLRPGASVLLVDKAAFPRDKACGDGLGPHAVDELAALGAAGILVGYPPIRGLRPVPAVTDRLEEITIPTLVVVGADDLSTTVEMARGIHGRIAGSELVILPSARHFSPVEQPAAWNAAVLDFLSRVGYK